MVPAPLQPSPTRSACSTVFRKSRQRGEPAGQLRAGVRHLLGSCDAEKVLGAQVWVDGLRPPLLSGLRSGLEVEG